MNTLKASEFKSILWGFLHDYKVQKYEEDEELIEKTFNRIIELEKKDANKNNDKTIKS